jgi:hypothetical protein
MTEICIRTVFTVHVPEVLDALLAAVFLFTHLSLFKQMLYADQPKNNIFFNLRKTQKKI